MTVSVSGIADVIISEASRIGGGTWMKIRQAAPLYIRGFAQTAASIAAGVARGEISKKDAAMYAKNARLLLIMGIANTAQIVMVQVQAFIDNVLKAVKGAINGMLPLPIL